MDWRSCERCRPSDASSWRVCLVLQVKLESGLEELRALSAERRFKLEATRAFHEFMRESGDVEEWIAQQLQTASAEDYGQDYEHLQVRVGQDYEHLQVRAGPYYQNVPIRIREQVQ